MKIAEMCLKESSTAEASLWKVALLAGIGGLVTVCGEERMASERPV